MTEKEESAAPEPKRRATSADKPEAAHPEDAAPAAQSAPEAPRATPRMLTPAEWAREKKLMRPADPRLPQSVPWTDPRHAVADRLHGWSDHAYHFQGPDQQFRLTEPDYLAALEAGAAYPTVPPHAPALAPSHVGRWRDFVPKKSRKRKGA